MKDQSKDLSRNSCVCSDSLYLACYIVVQIHIGIERDRERNEASNTKSLHPISKRSSTKGSRDTNNVRMNNRRRRLRNICIFSCDFREKLASGNGKVNSGFAIHCSWDTRAAVREAIQRQLESRGVVANEKLTY